MLFLLQQGFVLLPVKLTAVRVGWGAGGVGSGGENIPGSRLTENGHRTLCLEDSLELLELPGTSPS